jgi:predicted amidophosphoribosyltransferase
VVLSRVGEWFRVFDEAMLFRCFACGAKGNGVCGDCLAQLQDEVSNDLFLISNDPFPQKCLYLWENRDSVRAHIIRSLILGAKGDSPTRLCEIWAHEFVRRSGFMDSRNHMIFITPPKRDGDFEYDHAGALAREVAVRLGACHKTSLFRKVEDGPKKEERLTKRLARGLGLFSEAEGRSQKTKSKAERAELRFAIMADAHLPKNTAGCGHSGSCGGCLKKAGRSPRYVFLDDVLVTGASARAAWVALGRPRGFEAWTVAYKQGCARSGSLNPGIFTEPGVQGIS